MKILVVEDEPDIRTQLVQFLRSHGHLVDEAEDGEQATEIGVSNDYDVVILDPGLPKRDGVAVLTKWRKSGKDFPVLVLSGTRDGTEEQIHLINAGLSMFMSKPVDLQKVLAYVNNAGNSPPGKPPHKGAKVSYAGLEIDTHTKQVVFENKMLALSKTEYTVLWYLAKKEGQSASREELADHCLGRDRGPEQINVYIARLRKVTSPALIRNRRGEGYYLAG